METSRATENSRTCSLSDDAGSRVAGGSKGAGIARTKVSLLSSSLPKGEKAKMETRSSY